MKTFFFILILLAVWVFGLILVNRLFRYIMKVRQKNLENPLEKEADDVILSEELTHGGAAGGDLREKS